MSSMVQLAALPEQERVRLYNETLAAWPDHGAWCRECLTIPNLEGKVVPFDPTPAQVRLFDAIKRQRERGRPVRIIFLKPRRVHVSAATATHLFHEVPFTSNQHALIVSHNKRSSREIYGYIEHFQDHYKPFRGLIGLPGVKSRNETYGLQWDNGSYVEIGTAKNVDTGRSFSLRHLQLDEFAFWPDASRLMTALLPSVPKDAGTSVIIPSTANGVGGPFYDLWQRACDRSADTEWVPVFFAWWEFPTAVMPLAVPAGEFQASLSRNHPVYGDEIAEKEKYGLSNVQLNWRRWMITNECEGNIDKFRQEYPGEPTEAFISSGRPRFSALDLSRMPVIGDGITGDLEIDRVGLERMPLLRVRSDLRGALTVYRRPERHREYTIGADPCTGIDVRSGEAGNSDPDWSVAQVLDLATGEQVAHFRQRVQPAAFGEILYALGWWFNWAYLVPEVNGAGLGSLDKLLELEYPLGKIHRRRQEVDAINSSLLQHYGFETTTVSRASMISRLDAALREQSIIVHHPNTLQELRTFVVRPSGRAEHADECHDDEVLAMGLAVVGLESAPRAKPATEAGVRAVVKYGKRRYRDEDD